MDLSDAEILNAVNGDQVQFEFYHYIFTVHRHQDTAVLTDTLKNRNVTFILQSLLEADNLEAISYALHSGIIVNTWFFIGALASVSGIKQVVTIDNVKLNAEEWFQFVHCVSQIENTNKQFSMSPKYERLLRHSRVFLTRNLRVSHHLITYLYVQHVLCLESMEYLHSNLCATNSSKVRYLLELLPKRGPKAFSIFINGLLRQQQNNIVEYLCHQMTSQ